MIEFAYEKAESIQHALSLIESHKNAYLYAGGTDLLLKIKHGQAKPNLLVGIGHLKELQYVREDTENQTLHIGAGTKIDELLKNQLIQKHAGLLLRAGREIGSMEIKNMATVGGNICSVGANCGACGLPGCKTLSGGGNVKPCQYASFADLILPLMVLDAKLLFAGKEGEKTLSLREFLPRAKNKTRTLLKEICLNINDNEFWGYARMATNNTMGVTLVAAAVNFISNNDKSCAKMILAVGGASLQSPLVVNGVDEIVRNKLIDKDIIEKIIAEAIPQLSYLDNLQFSLGYIVARSKILISEAIVEAVEGR